MHKHLTENYKMCFGSVSMEVKSESFVQSLNDFM